MGFCIAGSFWWDGEASYQVSVGLSLFFIILFSYSYFGCFIFARGWAFFLFQPSILRSFVVLRLIRETCAHWGEEEKLFHGGVKSKLYCKERQLLAYTYIYSVITSSFCISALTRA
jgi:hypothetical protein